jgi:7-carboxy-7-deazaguanine synthase
MQNSLKVNEMFSSIQGEGTHQGLLCFFIRLTGCNLRCSYCDTKYAYFDGEFFSAGQIIDKWKESGIKLVQITGGEPLLQENVYELMEALLKKNAKILLETNGSVNIKNVPKNVVKIVDIKTPGSKTEDSFLIENLRFINDIDQIKFVVTGMDDFLWSKKIIEKFCLDKWCSALVSPAYNMAKPAEIAEMLIINNMNVRFQIQLHKMLWREEREIFITKKC